MTSETGAAQTASASFAIPTAATPSAGSAETRLALKTLAGDIRDVVLSEFKAIHGPWQKASEDEQGRLIRRAADIADRLVRGAVDLIAAAGLPALSIQVGKVTIDGSACKGVYECYVDDDALLRIRHLQGARAMFVLASPDAYRHARGPAEPDNVGTLAMPKDPAEGERADEAALAKVGTGKPRKRKGDTPPTIDATHPDTSDAPFHAPADEPYPNPVEPGGILHRPAPATAG